MEAEQINGILGIKESFELPDRLMEILRDATDRERIFEEFLTIESDLSFDWFTDYFQESHSNHFARCCRRLPEPTKTRLIIAPEQAA